MVESRPRLSDVTVLYHSSLVLELEDMQYFSFCLSKFKTFPLDLANESVLIGVRCCLIAKFTLRNLNSFLLKLIVGKLVRTYF